MRKRDAGSLFSVGEKCGVTKGLRRRDVESLI